MNLLKHIDYSETNKILLTGQNTLRKLVGILGVFLPIFLYLFLRIDTGYKKPLESISHYYFTRVCGIFLITVSLLAFFLIIYKGKQLIDFFLSTTAGVFALVLLLFPTDNIDPKSDGFVCSVTALKHPADFRVHLHYISASIFLLSLACIALFLFTKSDKPRALRTKQKKIRNVFYIICGAIMIAALLTAFLGYKKVIKLPVFGGSITFWMETIAVESFGFAWLIKAEVFFKDKPRKVSPLHTTNMLADHVLP